MEAQTPPNSQSLTGYPTSASGGIAVPGRPAGLRGGSDQDVPDAVVNPVAPVGTRTEDVRFGPAKPIKTGRSPAPLIAVGVIVVLLIIVVLILTGFFGLF